MLRRRPARIATAVAALWALPAAPAEAHGLPSPPGVPVPGYLFTWAAAIVLVASFAALGALWRSPRLEGGATRPLMRVPAGADTLCGAIGIAVFGLVVYAGLAGTPLPTANLAPTFVYVVFWVALVPLSALVGNVFAAFNPWRAFGRAMGALTSRVSPEWIAPRFEYPRRLGHWPAVAGIAGFAWLELIAPGRSVPATVAYAALVYTAVQLVGMTLFGVEAWTRRGDAFSVYFGLIARLAPIARKGRNLVTRAPLSGLTELEVTGGTIALLCVMIGSTAFDGLSSTVWWAEIAPHLQRALAGLGASPEVTSELTSAVGLVAMIALVAAVYALGAAGMRTVDRTRSRPELARLFVHSLVPIAAAYIVAHYFTFLVFQGQAVGTLASNPLGAGAATATIDYSLISKSMVWYIQVGALLLGHVGGLVLAHDRALVTYKKARSAARSQYWMLTVMVGFTSLGLFLLASAKR
jgi:hypothetical protein